MIACGEDTQKTERLAGAVSLALALIMQLSAGLLLVSMCREEILSKPTPMPLITVNLAPEPAPAIPAKTSTPEPTTSVEELQPGLPQPEPEFVQPPGEVPIEPPALKKVVELKRPAPPKKSKNSKKVEPEPVKLSKKTVEKPVSRPERAKPVVRSELPLPAQTSTPVLPEPAMSGFSPSVQAARTTSSQTEKPDRALSGEEQKAIARYLAQVRRSLDRSRVYPPEARKKRIEGIVSVKFRIAEDGLVAGTEVSDSAPGLLADAVIKMLSGRRFPPPPSGWLPSTAIELNINFNLR